MVALAQRLAQLPEPPFGVRMAFEEQIDRLPRQSHQHVAAPAPASALADQLGCQVVAQADVVGAQQAVMGEAQRLDPRPRVLTAPRFVEQRPHTCVLPPAW